MEPTTLTVSSVGQITLPKSIRKLLNLEKGTKVNVTVNQDTKTITLKRQKTHEEIFADLEELRKRCPKPDPRSRYMTVGEMSLEQAKYIEGETWV